MRHRKKFQNPYSDVVIGKIRNKGIIAGGMAIFLMITIFIAICAHIPCPETETAVMTISHTRDTLQGECYFNREICSDTDNAKVIVIPYPANAGVIEAEIKQAECRNDSCKVTVVLPEDLNTSHGIEMEYTDSGNPWMCRIMVYRNSLLEMITQSIILPSNI